MHFVEHFDHTVTFNMHYEIMQHVTFRGSSSRIVYANGQVENSVRVYLWVHVVVQISDLNAFVCFSNLNFHVGNFHFLFYNVRIVGMVECFFVNVQITRVTFFDAVRLNKRENVVMR